ncbi:endolytic transglycosylase MltG [Lichenifustis flavocetrariae]|uniref:Endolytic murein transglycosylase n=1 Tax=Lichenifustis flavocetrariae TaxID=2949735 RepID=A0AA41YTV5_9HYPH|nr:endolytic transglycosylase MltG [Lichenifustis flavocetrariae]MCW6508064.1 endolytic transglycosylase MltG [Lichenifustis flavocetrariae]
MSGVLSFLIVVVVVAVIGWSFLSEKITAPGPLPADKTVNIPKGDDVELTLEENGVIDNAMLMKATLLLERSRGSVKAGEYLFKQNASLQDVIDTLISGKQVLHALTIPEGLTSQQVVDRMRENDVLVGDLKAVPPEGSLMPDTYKFARGTTREQLVRTMQQEERKVVSDVWAHRTSDTVIRSPYELVTLASIVEKETGKADERPRVAGVFINRLSRNIPLQSDPTIVYGLVGGKGTLGRGILKSEVDQKTPYNTYAIVGLPPGPIANPGKAALEAVASPSRTKELYFVADGTGGHAFAETLDQHRANVLRWRQIERDAKDKVAPDAAGSVPPAPGTTPGAVPKNQRGDAGQDGNVFGDLLPTGNAASGSRSPDRFAAMPLPVMGDTNFASSGAKAAAASQANPFDDLDIEVDGVRSKEAPPVFADTDTEADTTPGPAASQMTFALSAQRQAEMRARESAYGLPAASSTLQPDRVQTAAAPEAAPPLPGGKVRIFDASEGTPLDPLRDHSYDLMTAKSVPALKALPPMPAGMAR